MARKKTSAKTLAGYESEHGQLAQRLSRIGFLWSGSLSERHLKCGNPRCACQNDPAARHGPYIYWSTKKGGKTISRKLPLEEAQVLEKWVANRQEVKKILDSMMAVSQKAFAMIMKQNEKERHHKVRP